VGARFSALVQTGPGINPATYNWVTGPFPGSKGPGCSVDHPPLLSLRLKKEYSYSLLPLWALMADSTVKFTFTFTFRKEYLLKFII
jgi:hypothetical protein